MIAIALIVRTVPVVIEVEAQALPIIVRLAGTDAVASAIARVERDINMRFPCRRLLIATLGVKSLNTKAIC